MKSSCWTYVVITPAHNAAQHIEKTIQSMIAQSVLPVRWVIVSDRSTDETDEIVQQYSRKHSFILYVRKTVGEGRHTANKVAAINFALEHLRDVQYDFIGNLDADVAFGPGYFEFLLQKFEENPTLGIGGGRIHVLSNGKSEAQRNSLESVAGAVQFFRRECFEAIGGYESLRDGFEDGLAEISARLHRWTTRSYPEQVVVHYGEVGTAGRSILRFQFDAGVRDFRLGFRFSYHVIRSLYYLWSKPPVVSAFCTMAGYLWACVTLRSRVLRPSMIKYMRDEQRKRMRDNFRKLLSIGAKPVET